MSLSKSPARKAGGKARKRVTAREASDVGKRAGKGLVGSGDNGAGEGGRRLGHASAAPGASSTRNRKSVQKSRSTGNKQRRPAIGELFEALVALQARLRAPEGCPWDREQTHDSLRPYLLEETYEVLDALESPNPGELAGELGDLLLQILFHADLAREAGRFNIGDVIEHVHAKMVRRHPHVFGNVQARTPAEVLRNWEQIKAEERKAQEGKTQEGKADKTPAKGEREVSQQLNTTPRGDARMRSTLDGVPRILPALLEAQQLTTKAARVGFDWQNVKEIFNKLSEEVAELEVALQSGAHASIEEEMGDVLFVCVNVARFLHLDAELALKKANRKFVRRFQRMETAASERGHRLSDYSAGELEALWSVAKALERPDDKKARQRI